MPYLYKFISKSILLSFFLFPLASLATISLGDIAVIGFNGDGTGSTRDFTVVTLAPIAAGEVIFFTDIGISAGTFNNSSIAEGSFSVTTASTIASGTVVQFFITGGAATPVTSTPSIGTISATGWSNNGAGTTPWGTNGDQVLIYQAGPTFIFGFNNSILSNPPVNGWFTGSSPSIYFSNLPPGLTAGTNAIGFTGSGHPHDLYYSGTRTGTKVNLLTAITNTSNWTTGAAAFDLSVGGTIFTGSNPIFSVSFPLPVNLLSFSASKTDDTHLLSWKTANEQGFSHFEVEKSLDARNYAAIGEVAATGDGSYQFTEKTSSDVNSFYRLRMVDIDERYSFSPVILLMGSQEKSEIRTYPNPTTGVLNITSTSPIRSITVTTMQGRRTLTISGSFQQSEFVSLEGLAPGMYIVRVEAEKDVLVQKVVKQ